MCSRSRRSGPFWHISVLDLKSTRSSLHSELTCSTLQLALMLLYFLLHMPESEKSARLNQGHLVHRACDGHGQQNVQRQCDHLLCSPAPPNPPWRRRTSQSSSTRNRGTLGSMRSCFHVCGRIRSRLWLTNMNHPPLILTEVRFISDDVWKAGNLHTFILFKMVQRVSLAHVQVWFLQKVFYSSSWGKRHPSSCRTG